MRASLGALRAAESRSCHRPSIDPLVAAQNARVDTPLRHDVLFLHFGQTHWPAHSLSNSVLHFRQRRGFRTSVSGCAAGAVD
jgi:hypothetical protein